MQQAEHRFIRALYRQPVDRTPVWIMRQAGRYLPEYKQVRAQAGSFMKLCQTPELACQVTLQPLERFALDAAILFSDILTIPDAMGLGLHFTEGEGPKFSRPVRSAADVDALGLPDPEQELGYVMDAVRMIKQSLAGGLPLIGFAGSPWTVATYMVEGESSKTFSRIKGMLYHEPDTLTALLDKLIIATSHYLEAQIRAGAEAIMLFDTWGGVLTPSAYQRFSLTPMARIIEHLQSYQVPIILFTKGGGQWLEQMAASGATALGLDWTTSIKDAKARVGQQVALQGNVDPCQLYAEPEAIEAAVAANLADYGEGSGHIFNLGHGIYPDVNPEHLGALIDAVVRLSPAYHQ